jgi:nucleoside-diphosphate-sugar epimerase
MRAVVVGATGFVGRHVCATLAASGARVTPVSRTGGLVVDLAREAGQRRLAELLAAQRTQVVVNAAGSVWRCTEQEMYRDNATLVEGLVRVVAGQPRPVRLIQLGTVMEYGPGTPGTGTPEDRAPAPATAYGRSKLLGTEAVLHGCRTAGVQGVVLRVANVCGPGTPPGSLLRTVADHLTTGDLGNAVLRFGSLRVWRDFVDAGDVADAVLAAARAPADAIAGQVINIGRGEAVQMRWLVERMIALAGVPVSVVEDGTAARSDGHWQQLDIGKAYRLLGWRPRRGLDESLKDLLAHLWSERRDDE